MRSRGSRTISSSQVHQWALNWLVQAKLMKDHGWRCTQAVVLNIVLRAAAHCISVSAACRDLSEGPWSEATFSVCVNYHRARKRQGRVYTCTRNPRLRLLFVMVALLLRNLWVWIHQTRLAKGSGERMTLHLELLRFQRMLNWIVHEIVALYHDGSTPCVDEPP